MCRIILALLLVTTLPAVGQGSKVTFRDDHVVLVDNKPFFPLGLYYCNEEFEVPTGKLLAVLKEYGFNTLGYYRWGTPDWKKEMDRVHAAGHKVWIRGHNGFDITSPEVEKAAREQVKQTKDHPALLFWEFQDEPILNKVSIEGSRKGYDLVKKEDLNHPMLVVEWPGASNRFHLWKGIGDIFATDLYPIPRERGYGRLSNHDITQMRDYIRTLREAHGDKPILLVLQAWNWEPLNYGEKGYPTVRESRFMAYQSVIHGATGLHYYGQVHCTKPNSASSLWSEAKDPAKNKAEFEKCVQLNKKYWEGHKGFFQELAKASAIFVLRDAKIASQLTLVKQDPEPTDAGVEFRTKQDGKNLYVLSVNANPRARDVTLRLPPSHADLKEVHVLFENRKVAVKDGTFTDRFEPYETHVYGTEPSGPKP
jgi:hypothetical protein